MSSVDPRSVTQPFRVWHQSMTELQSLDVYRQALIGKSHHVLGPECVLEIAGLREGTYHGATPTDALANAFIYHRALDQVIDNAIRAERNGFDFFVIGSFSEPFLREIRSAVNIPVVSILESSILIGCSLGKKIVPIANSPKVALMVASAVEKHGLMLRVMTARSIMPELNEPALATAFSDPEPVLDSFSNAARDAVAQGAEVIMPAEGVLASLLSHHGVRRIDGAPVLDVFAVAWLHGVMLARLRATTDLQVSRVGSYAGCDEAMIDAYLK